MAENPANRNDHDARRARLGAALRENLKRRKAQARGRDGREVSPPPSDSADEQRPAGNKETQG